MDKYDTLVQSFFISHKTEAIKLSWDGDQVDVWGPTSVASYTFFECRVGSDLRRDLSELETVFETDELDARTWTRK